MTELLAPVHEADDGVDDVDGVESAEKAGPSTVILPIDRWGEGRQPVLLAAGAA